MSKSSKLTVIFLLSISVFGVAFPVAVAVANRPDRAPMAAPVGTVEIGPVTVTEENEGTATIVLDPVIVTGSVHRSAHAVAAAPVRERSIQLQQGGRPGHYAVNAWGI